MEPKKDISDLIPKGLGVYWAVAFLFGSLACLLGYAHLQLPAWSARLGVETIAPLDLSSPRSFLNWMISSLLLLSAVVAGINFRLGRQFRDSFAKSIAWFWAGLALVILSMDLQVGVRETFRDALIALSGTSLYGNGTAWYLAAYVFVLGIIGSRILVDMASYAPAMGLFLLAVAGSVGVVLLHLGLLPIPWDESRLLLLQSGLQTMAAVFLLLSFSLFGRRQVFRDPQVALKWFAKVWNQAPLAMETEKPAVEVASPVVAVTVAPASASEAKTVAPVSAAETKTASNKPKPVPVKTETTSTKKLEAAPARPVVQKSAETIPFKPVEKKDDEEFDLSVIA